MSNRLTSLVYSRKAGSAVRKSILVYCADKASDDGTGIWASKGTIAAETDIDRSTIIRNMAALERDGLIQRIGSKKCTNGSTVEYRLVVASVEALPETGTRPLKPVSSRHRSQPATSGTAPPVAQRDPTSGTAPPQGVAQRHPNHPRTTLEPIGGGEAREDVSFREQVMAAAGVPSNPMMTHWMPPGADTRVHRWSADLGLTQAEILAVVRASRPRNGDPPSSPNYFSAAMKRLAAEKSAPPMQPEKGPTNDRSGKNRHSRADADAAISEARQALADGRITSVVAGQFAPGASKRR